MLIPAEFRASSLEQSRAFGSKNQPSRPPRDQIFLAVEIWNPEAVDHVVGRQLQQNRAAYRNVDFVRSDHGVAGRFRRIAHFPPPLMADDLDSERAWTHRGRHRAAGEDAGRQQPQKHYSREDGGGRDRARAAPLSFWRFGCPAADEGDRESGDQDDRNTAGDAEHQPVKVCDSGCLGACGVERRVTNPAGRERKKQRGSAPGHSSQRDIAPSPACMCSSRGPGGAAIPRSARSAWTYVTICQTWYCGILPRHEGIPFGRPSTIEV